MVAAGGRVRRPKWELAFRRSAVGRAITRRLPGKLKRTLKAVRRTEHRTVAQQKNSKKN